MAESESDAPDDVRERRLAARRKMAEACGEYADVYDPTAGGVVTGYLTVMEILTADGYYALWLTGTGGEPAEEKYEALPSWRVEGLCQKVQRDIWQRRVTTE